MKKVDSMDCHDFASAKSRNDRKKAFLCKKDSRHCGGAVGALQTLGESNARPTKRRRILGLASNAQNLTSKQKILRFAMRKQGCAAFCAEISLDGYRTSKRQAPCFIAQS